MIPDEKAKERLKMLELDNKQEYIVKVYYARSHSTAPNVIIWDAINVIDNNYILMVQTRDGFRSFVLKNIVSWIVEKAPRRDLDA